MTGSEAPVSIWTVFMMEAQVEFPHTRQKFFHVQVHSFCVGLSNVIMNHQLCHNTVKRQHHPREIVHIPTNFRNFLVRAVSAQKRQNTPMLEFGGATLKNATCTMVELTIEGGDPDDHVSSDLFQSHT